MSPGFFVPPLMRQAREIINQATQASVVINTIDARGLYVSSVYDASNSGTGSPLKTQLVSAEGRLQEDVLAELSEGTGGLFFHNRNDIDQGVLQAAAEPEVSYVLGFSPQNLKPDGKYHHLKVTLTNKQKWALQARRGYFAPHGESDPDAKAKDDIQQAIYSQSEMRDLPIACQTQFSKTPKSASLSVVAHLETNGLSFRRDENMNHDNLTVATAVFGENGNLLSGQQRVVELKLNDATLNQINKTGLNVPFSFDLQPGTFLVRIVVRDSEGAQMAAMTRGVLIP
jgi:hypothetical protein